MYDDDAVFETVALYALPIYLYMYFYSCRVYALYTYCRESGSDTSASVVSWWYLMCF